MPNAAVLRACRRRPCLRPRTRSPARKSKLRCKPGFHAGPCWGTRLMATTQPCALGVRTGATVWRGEHRPVAAPIIGKRGKTKTHLTRDELHQPISALTLARALGAQCFRSVTWRQGTSEPQRSRFARVRVRTAHRDVPREEEWLVVEWPKDEAEPSRYWLSTHPKDMPFAALVESIKARWRIERDYQELKQEFGLGHYEGRNWRGFHHHASLCIAAYGFLMRERLSGAKKPPTDPRNLSYPRVSARAGPRPMQRHVPNSISILRFRLAAAIVKGLRQCPCCGRSAHQVMNI